MHLSAAEVNQYKERGWIDPFSVTNHDTTKKFRDLLFAAEKMVKLSKSDYRYKSNVLFKWVDDLSRNPKIVSTVKELIGPDFHCWDTIFWIKWPNEGRDVSFHQDCTYWNFDKPEKAVNVWYTFTDVTLDHGPLEYYAGSHKLNALNHHDVKTNSNLLMRGQTATFDASDEPIKVTAAAGDVIIHHPYIVHGSGKNVCDTPRLCMSMIYASTECKPILSVEPESTVMICGEDKYNYMMHDPRPTGVWDVDVKNWQAASDRQHANYHSMKQRANHV